MEFYVFEFVICLGFRNYTIMALHDLLKNLKSIQPDAEYARRSRHHILSSRAEIPRRLSFRQIILQTIQTGPVLALAVVLILLIAGGASTSRYFSPLRLTSLDPTSLRAEADAIDIQIQLTNIAYSEPTNETTTIAIAPTVLPSTLLEKKIEIKNQATQIAKDLGIAPPASTSSITIDEALRKLAE